MLTLGLTFTWQYAQDTMAYEKSDFIIEGHILKGFTPAGVNKHNNLKFDKRVLIIPQEWGITEIADYAFGANALNFSGYNDMWGLNLSSTDVGAPPHHSSYYVYEQGEDIKYGVLPFLVVKLPDGLLKIGNHAFLQTFQGPNYTQSYILSNGVKALGTNHYPKIEIPASVTHIGDRAFFTSFWNNSDYRNNHIYREINLKGVSNLQYMGNAAFAGANRVKSIDFSSNQRITEIPVGTFSANKIDHIVSALNDFELEEFIWSKDKNKKLNYRVK